MSTLAWAVSSPLPYANTTPPAITTGSAFTMFRESQAGASRGPLGLGTSLNAATAPCTTSPCSMGALNFECLGPQKGMRT